MIIATQAQSNPTQKGKSDNITQINRPEISLDYHYYFDDIWEFNLEAFWQNQKDMNLALIIPIDLIEMK